MGTLQIFSNKADDLIFLNEMARRMNLKTKMKMPEPDLEHAHPIINLEDTAEGIVEGIKRALIEVEEAHAGKRKLKTLEDLLDENRD